MSNLIRQTPIVIHRYMYYMYCMTSRLHKWDIPSYWLYISTSWMWTLKCACRKPTQMKSRITHPSDQHHSQTAAPNSSYTELNVYGRLVCKIYSCWQFVVVVKSNFPHQWGFVWKTVLWAFAQSLKLINSPLSELLCFTPSTSQCGRTQCHSASYFTFEFIIVEIMLLSLHIWIKAYAFTPY